MHLESNDDAPDGFITVTAEGIRLSEEENFADIVKVNAYVLSKLAEKAAIKSASLRVSAFLKDRNSSKFPKVHREYIKAKTDADVAIGAAQTACRTAVRYSIMRRDRANRMLKEANDRD